MPAWASRRMPAGGRAPMTQPSRPTSSAAPISTQALQREEEDHWVTLTTFGDAAHADVARGLMEQAQIPARLTDAHTASMLGVPTLALGGVGLQVPQRELQRAAEILKDSQGRKAVVSFRVRHTRTILFPSLFMGVTAGVAAATTVMGVHAPGAMTSVLVAGVVGYLAGRQSVYHLCSNLSCGGRLQPGTPACPNADRIGSSRTSVRPTGLIWTARR